MRRRRRSGSPELTDRLPPAGPVLSPLRGWSHCEGCAAFVLILQVRKLSLKETEQPAQAHAGGRSLVWDEVPKHPHSGSLKDVRPIVASLQLDSDGVLELFPVSMLRHSQPAYLPQEATGARLRQRKRRKSLWKHTVEKNTLESENKKPGFQPYPTPCRVQPLLL